MFSTDEGQRGSVRGIVKSRLGIVVASPSRHRVPPADNSQGKSVSFIGKSPVSRAVRYPRYNDGTEIGQKDTNCCIQNETGVDDHIDDAGSCPRGSRGGRSAVVHFGGPMGPSPDF
jgi:hypothetical protein